MPKFFKRYNEEINKALKDEINDRLNPIYETHKYYMGFDNNQEQAENSVGKRLRPSLVMLSSDAVDGNHEVALLIATALEYVHNFSLIHDDLEDRDKIRHHKPTIWTIWGESAAIISGNGMLKIADNIMGRLADVNNIEPSFILKLQIEMASSYLKMMEGQYFDIAYESVSTITTSEYLNMIELKTGALIQSAMYLGSITKNLPFGNPSVSGHMKSIGHELGRVYQIRDDILGIWGTKATGKPVGADLIRKKKSLPIIHALNNPSREIRTKIRRFFSTEIIEGNDVENILNIMDRIGTYQYCQSLAQVHWNKANAIISGMDLKNDFVNDLKELGEFLLTRKL